MILEEVQKILDAAILARQDDLGVFVEWACCVRYMRQTFPERAAEDGIIVLREDIGPGIANIDLAMAIGYSGKHTCNDRSFSRV